MGPPIRPQEDPLADYSPSWRQGSRQPDPLDDYAPNWRQQSGTGLFGTAARLAVAGATPGALKPLTDETVTPRKQNPLERGFLLARGGTPALQAAEAPFKRPMTDEEQTEDILSRASPEALSHPKTLAAAGTAGTVGKEVAYVAATKRPSEAIEDVAATGARQAFPRVAQALDELSYGSTGASRVVGAARGASRAAAASVPYSTGREIAEGTPAEEIPRRVGENAAVAAAAGGLFGGARAPRISQSRSVAENSLIGDVRAARPGNPEPFKTLGLDARLATPEDVQAAWRERIRDVHPDVNPSPEAADLARRYNAARDDALTFLKARVAQPPREAPAGAAGASSRAQEARPTEEAPRAPNEPQRGAGATPPPSAEPSRPAPPRGLEEYLRKTGLSEEIVQDIVTGKRPAPARPTTAGAMEEFPPGSLSPDVRPFPGDQVGAPVAAAPQPPGELLTQEPVDTSLVVTTPPASSPEATAPGGTPSSPPAEPVPEKPADSGSAQPPKAKWTRKPSYAVEGSSPKFAKMSEEALQDRYLELADRAEKASKDATDNTHIWVREDPNMDIDASGTTKRSGVARGGKAGRAVNRQNQDSRLMGEIEAELKVRGHDHEPATIMERAEERKAIGAEPETKVPTETAPATEGEREWYESTERGVKSGFGFKFRSQIVDDLAKSGHDRAHVEGLNDDDLARLALGSESMSPEQESKILDVLWPSGGEMGSLKFPLLGGRGRLEPNKYLDALRRILSPEARGPEAASAARLLRKHIGTMRRQRAVEREALKQARKVVPSLQTKEGLEFYQRGETGQGQVTKDLQDANDVLRRLYDQLVADTQNLGTGKLADPIEHYLAHIWKDPIRARDVMAQIQARRPLQGGKSFLKQRTIPYLIEGLRAGLDPVTWNPIDMQLLKMREMGRYIMAQRFLQDAKAEGIAQFFPVSKQGPVGWMRLDDPTFTVWGRGENGELILRGNYWMPEKAAQVVKNYLSPGLRGNAIYDAYMGLGNSLNQFQLGVSGFHAGFSTYTSVISRVAQGVGEMRTGRLGSAARSFLTTPIAPPLMIARGLGLRRAYLNPGTGSILEQKLAQMLERSGGQHMMDPTYKTDAVKALKEAAAQGHIPKVLAHTMGTALWALAWPTMEFYVPVIKLGAFAQLAESEIDRLGPGATDAEIDKAMQEVWHTIDNRFGQVSYDTRFWNNAIKHVLMGAVRAVGWDAGTVDEHLGGGLKLLQGKPDTKADFFIALPLTIALISVVIQFALTGKGPESVQDLFEPQDGTKDQYGNANRVVPASYMKDLIAFGRHPVQTVEHKLHPILDFLASLLHNKDFYGDQIRNPNDPASVQLDQVFKYIRDQFTPITIRNVQEGKKRGEVGSREALSFIGINPASREAVRSKAQNLMYELLGAQQPSGATPEQAEQRQMRSEDLRTLRGGQPVDLRNQGLTRRQQRDLFRRARTNPLVDQFKRLPVEGAQRVYDLGSPEEKRLWGPVLFTKLRNRQRG